MSRVIRCDEYVTTIDERDIYRVYGEKTRDNLARFSIRRDDLQVHCCSWLIEGERYASANDTRAFIAAVPEISQALARHLRMHGVERVSGIESRRDAEQPPSELPRTEQPWAVRAWNRAMDSLPA